MKRTRITFEESNSIIISTFFKTLITLIILALVFILGLRMGYEEGVHKSCSSVVKPHSRLQQQSFIADHPNIGDNS